MPLIFLHLKVGTILVIELCAFLLSCEWSMAPDFLYPFCLFRQRHFPQSQVKQHRPEIGHGILAVDVLHARGGGELRHVDAVGLQGCHGQIGMTAGLVGSLGTDLTHTASARA